jgi:hypothetical protein
VNIWVPVIAALGASALTVFGSFWLGEHQNRLRKRADQLKERSVAYGVLLARSYDLIMRVGVTDSVVSLSSSPAESIELTFRSKPLDLFDFFDWMDKSFQPLNDAWSRVWAVGSQDAINAANLLFKASTDLMSKSMSSDLNVGWLRTAINGSPWTEEQRAALAEAARAVARARVTFAAIMREETARESVKLVSKLAERRSAAEQNLQDTPDHA